MSPGHLRHTRPAFRLFQILCQVDGQNELIVICPLEVETEPRGDHQEVDITPQGIQTSGSAWDARRSKTPSVLSPGVVRQVRPIVGPFHAILKLEMNYVVGGVVSHRNVVNVHIFVSEYWF